MNVTSLLNSSAAAQAAGGRLPIDQSGDGSMAMYQTQERAGSMRTSSDSRLPNRNRTPWDAGGYSLPLTLNVKSAQTPTASRPSVNTNFDSLPAEKAGSTSPNSPKHKFSDSRSSLSSYTTISSSASCHSRSHSRISSLSTVSEYQPLSTFGSDSTPTERRTSVPESGMTCSPVVEIEPPSPRRPGLDDVSPYMSDSESPMTSHRARSPSDAMMMMRNRGLTGSASPTESKRSTFLHPDSPTGISARIHKRTVSAPDFPSLSSLNRPHYPSFGPMAEPTPPKSPTQGDNSQNEDNLAISTDQAAQSEAALDAEPEQPKCMFVHPCTTGSSLRKAISHIFGRNKLCTKSIPAHIWVHYCRKHYQRSRYRNATDYALRQVDLVLLQVTKVQEWSDDNVKCKRRGAGVLKHWTLQARKREAKRLQDTESRKRRYAEEEDDDPSLGSVGTAIPIWLQPRLNQDYDTTHMLEIVEEIKVHMTNGEITQIPDIEILPEITTDGNESRPRTTVRRSSSAGGHRKTQSEAYRTPPAMGAYSNSSRIGLFAQDNKRMRSGPYSLSMQNLPHRPVMGMSQPQPYSYQFPQNNAFATIAENQADHSYWNGGYSSNSVLPQPVHQRSGAVPNLDHNAIQEQQQSPYAPQGRPSMHARSMSENPGLRTNEYGNTEFRFPAQPGNGYQQQQQDVFGNLNMGHGQGPQAYGYGPPTPQGYGNPYGMSPRDGQDNIFGSYYQPDWTGPRGQHSRVQSTPAVHQQHHQQHHQQQPVGPPHMSAVNGQQGMLPSMNNMGPQHQMYQGGQQHNGFQAPRVF